MPIAIFRCSLFGPVARFYYVGHSMDSSLLTLADVHFKMLIFSYPARHRHRHLHEECQQVLDTGDEKESALTFDPPHVPHKQTPISGYKVSSIHVLEQEWYRLTYTAEKVLQLPPSPSHSCTSTCHPSHSSSTSSHLGLCTPPFPSARRDHLWRRRPCV